MAETLSKLFVKAVDKLDIKGFKNISNIDRLSDLVEIAIKKYKNIVGKGIHTPPFLDQPPIF